jgi:hypothetical protein
MVSLTRGKPFLVALKSTVLHMAHERGQGVHVS